MRNLVTLCSFAVVLAMAARLGAQPVDPPEKQRQFCNPATSKDCSDDTMEVTFDRDGGDDSVFGYETFVANAPVDVTIMMDVKSNGPGGGDGVQGWSYGVDHDDAFLTINSVTVGGTDAERAITGGFVVAEGGTLVADGAEAGAGVALAPGPAVRVALTEADVGVAAGCADPALGEAVAVGGVARPVGPELVRAASSRATESRIAGDSGSNVMSRGSAE